MKLEPRQRFRCRACGSNGVRPVDPNPSCPCGAELSLWPAGETEPKEKTDGPA